MGQHEIKKKVLDIQAWDRQRRRDLLQQQSREREELLRPLVEACGEQGHEVEATSSRNIFGETFIVCKWCGVSLGVE